VEVIDRIDVANDPVNWVDPEGLKVDWHTFFKTTTTVTGPFKSTLQKGIDAADGWARKQALKQAGIPTATAKGLLGLTGGIGLTLALSELMNPRPAGEGSDILPPDWDRDRNGIPDLIEPLPQKDDC
jgi:hypothetical protein